MASKNKRELKFVCKDIFADQEEDMKHIKDLTGASVASQMRIAIDKYLKRFKSQEKTQNNETTNI